LNTTRYRNQKFDQFMEEALKTTNEVQRNRLYLQADQAALDDAPMMILYYDKDQRLLQPNVRNFPQNAMEYRNLREVYFVPEG
ncbi:MAG TPA: ABC transporter substrate-binding protein, partial [Chitinophagales bacterium]|nr:ABC transporter substrate-binding protein [Chitinophagales bacterium]